MKKKISIGVSFVILVAVLRFGVVMHAQDITTANVIISENNLGNGMYRLDFSVANAVDLYGVSLDMQYDAVKLQVVDQDGLPLSEGPVLSPSDTFGPNIASRAIEDVYGPANNGDAYVAIDDLKDNRISFVKFLGGNRIGVNIPGKSTIGFIYFKVREGQTFTGFGDLTLTPDAKLISNSAVCVKLSKSTGAKITPTKVNLPNDFIVNVTDQDLTYLAGSSFSVTFEDDMIKTFDISQIELVILHENDTFTSLAGASVIKNEDSSFTISLPSLPDTPSKGVFGVRVKVGDDYVISVKLKQTGVIEPLKYYPGYTNSSVIIEPQLSAISNLTSTSVPVKLTFGTKGSITLGSGVNILSEIEKYYNLQTYIDFHSDDGLYYVNVTNLSSVVDKEAVIQMNNVMLPAAKVSTTGAGSASNVTLNTTTHALSFEVTKLTPKWEATLGNTTLDVTMNCIDFADQSIVLTNLPAQLIVIRDNVVLRTMDFTATANQTTFTAQIPTVADLKMGDMVYAKIAGYSSEVYTLDAALIVDAVRTIPIKLCTGNLNNDNVIDSVDAELFSTSFGLTGTGKIADFNKDAIVDINDLYYISKNFQ